MGGPTWATVGCFVPVPLCLPSFSRPRGGRVVVASVELIIARSYGFWPRCDGGIRTQGRGPWVPQHTTGMAYFSAQLPWVLGAEGVPGVQTWAPQGHLPFVFGLLDPL